METFTCLVCLDGHPRTQLSANRHALTRTHISAKAPGSVYAQRKLAQSSLHQQNGRTSLSHTPTPAAPFESADLFTSYTPDDDVTIAYPDVVRSPTPPTPSRQSWSNDLNLTLALPPMQRLHQHLASLHEQEGYTNVLDTLWDEDEIESQDNQRSFILPG